MIQSKEQLVLLMLKINCEEFVSFSRVYIVQCSMYTGKYCIHTAAHNVNFTIVDQDFKLHLLLNLFYTL